MAITYRYVDWPAAAFDVTLGSSPRLGSIDGLVETAEMGNAGTSAIAFDDPDGTLGYASDGLVGWKMLIIEDDAAPAGNRRVFTGLIGRRQEASADSLVQGVARRVTPDLRDLNVIADLRELRGSGWKRPAESAKARLEAIIGSVYFPGVVDAGLVKYPSIKLEKFDYRGYRASDILDQIATKLNWDWHIYWSEADDAPALFFDNANRSTAYASDLRLSNLLADRDSWCDPVATVGYTGTFAVAGKPTLTRDPERVYSGVSVAFPKGSEHVERATTAAAFIGRDGVAPSSSPKSRAAARKLAQKFLDISDEEMDRITCEVELPAANVNDIRHGHLIEAKFRNLRGYADFSWFRVKQRTVKQPMKRDDRYRLSLILAPANPFTCTGKTDFNAAHGTVTGYVEQTSGASMWAHGTYASGEFAGITINAPDEAVGNIPVYGEANANDGNAATYSVCYQQVLRGSGCVSVVWQADFDATYIVCSTKGTTAVGSNSWQSRQPDAVEYWDGSAWQPAAGGVTLGPVSPLPQHWTFTFRTPIETTKLRLIYTYCGVAGAAGLWAWNTLGTRLYDWQILGEAA